MEKHHLEVLGGFLEFSGFFPGSPSADGRGPVEDHSDRWRRSLFDDGVDQKPLAIARECVR